MRVTPVFYYSYDKGVSWKGPHLLTGLGNNDALKSFSINTSRTDYQVLSPKECILFGSVTNQSWEDKVFAFKTIDGGLNFEFVSWITPPSDPYRALMPQTIPANQNDYISLIRRRARPADKSRDYCWIDSYKSGDGGLTWHKISTVTKTGSADSNGNPPALTRLHDGRLMVVYANRTTKMLLFRLSLDNGETWGDECIIRDDFASFDESSADLGYPRVMQRKDGKIVVLYYFADLLHGREQHIDCSIFSADDIRLIEKK